MVQEPWHCLMGGVGPFGYGINGQQNTITVEMSVWNWGQRVGDYDFLVVSCSFSVCVSWFIPSNPLLPAFSVLISTYLSLSLPLPLLSLSFSHTFFFHWIPSLGFGQEAVEETEFSHEACGGTFFSMPGLAFLTLIVVGPWPALAPFLSSHKHTHALYHLLCLTYTCIPERLYL